jgi:hypothetical protein
LIIIDLVDEILVDLLIIIDSVDIELSTIVDY